MSPSATPACHAKWRGAPGDQSAPNRATRASPVRQVPRLLRETKVDVSKCHACHARRRWMSPATQNEGGCQQVPLLPRKTKVEVAKSHSSRHQTAQCPKCHACHAKRRWMSPSATPATQSGAAPGDQSAPKRTTRASPVPQVPRLPRETKVDVTKCHACHAKRRWMSPSATPATRNEGRCQQVPRKTKVNVTKPRLLRKTKVDVTKCHPRLLRETKVDVSKCHACHAKRKWMSPSATPATQSGAAPRVSRHPSARPSAPPEPAQYFKCDLPRKTKANVTKFHACHAKLRWMSPSATPATQSRAAPRATKRAQAPGKTMVDVTKCHTCHAKRRQMSPSDQVPRLPRETKVDVTKCHACHVTKCHACHAKWRGTLGDQARPSGRQVRAQARHQSQPSAASATPAT